MRGGALQTAENATGVTFDSVTLILFAYALFAEAFVSLASFGYIGQVQVQNSAQAFNYLEIAQIYFGLLIGGMVIAVLLGFLGKTKFELGIKNPVSLATWLFGGLGGIFLITTVIGFLSTNGPYDLYKFTYAITGPSVLGFVTQPVFYESWIGANAFGEELFFIPTYLILQATFGRSFIGLVLANGITAFGFMILHYIKEVLLFGPQLSLGTILFLASTIIVRILLNEVAVYSRNFLPSAFAHMAYDIIVSGIFGAL